jgi:hypothetical protein
MTELERRCQVLLLAYPADYRAERGEEMLATLLEAARPAQRWPGRRETAGLMLGGLRARMLRNQRLSAWADVRLAILLALAIVVAFIAVRSAAIGIAPVWRGWSLNSRWLEVEGIAGLGLPAIVLIWCGPRLLAALALAGAGLLYLHLAGAWNPVLSAPVLPIFLLALFTVASPRPPRSWLCWVLLMVAWSALWELAAFISPLRPLVLSPWLLIPLLFCAVLWMVMDARLMLAAAIVLAVFLLSAAGLELPRSDELSYDAIIAMLSLTALVRMRRVSPL